MGSDYALNPPKPVWETHYYDNEEDLLMAISVILDGETPYLTRVQAEYDGKQYILKAHTGKYI